jgi:hypothetical protein
MWFLASNDRGSPVNLILMKLITVSCKPADSSFIARDCDPVCGTAWLLKCASQRPRETKHRGARATGITQKQLCAHLLQRLTALHSPQVTVCSDPRDPGRRRRRVRLLDARGLSRWVWWFITVKVMIAL